MKKIYTLLVLSLFALGVKAQLNTHYTFEEGLDTAWHAFANGADTTVQTLSVVLNPWAVDPNESDSVLQFTVQDDADTWVGMYIDLEEAMIFDADNHSISMMVYKTIISPLRMKIEHSLTGGDNQEVPMDNTLIDEWELMTWDMSVGIPHYYPRLTIFPDFPATRDGGTIVFIDNIGGTGDNTAVFEQSSGLSLKLYPNPVQHRMSIQYPEMTGASISDLLGKTVKSFEFQKTDSKVIELGNLEPGAYVVTVETGTGSYSGTFIKK